ncbi:MAG TPA: M14 family metallopeptidase [Pseudobdellovibrionaceae bacterium]|jgi:carboxypeptidase T
MKALTYFTAIGFAVLTLIYTQQARTLDKNLYWMKIRARDKFERSVIANTGVSIETTREDFVAATGTLEEKEAIEKLGWLETSFPLTTAMDFPTKDAAFHNYAELTQKIQELQQTYPNILRVSSAGKSSEGKDMWALRISGNLTQADNLPAIIYLGGHHAREHLSVELPLYYAEYFLSEYAKGTPRIVNLLNGRDIHILPAVNPDGLEYDVTNESYKLWRKNRSRNGDGTYGVDLNRNYGYQWGTGGSSSNTSSDTYKGPKAFSEPETQAIKAYIENHQNITTLLSFHTFSELILYPWGHKYQSIEVPRDQQVHQKMAEKMAEWNNYTAEQASALYQASGDTTDWAYGEHKIISFTFELDPANNGMGSAGFYPGTGVIPVVQQKNLEPVLYLLQYADNPYRVLDVNINPIP